MSLRVNMPPGCVGFRTSGNQTIDRAGKGSAVVLDDERAIKALRGSQHVSNGLISASGAVSIGTKKGRWCKNCAPARLWNAWSSECPRCGSPTTEM